MAENYGITERIKEILRNNGFSYDEVCEQDGEYYIDINQYTPEGEDWYESIWFDGTTEGFIEAVSDFADNFDVDEAASLWIEGRGTQGIPSSIVDIVEDAQWKKDTLLKLAAELKGRKIEPVEKWIAIVHDSSGENSFAEALEGTEEQVKQYIVNFVNNEIAEDNSKNNPSFEHGSTAIEDIQEVHGLVTGYYGYVCYNHYHTDITVVKADSLNVVKL